MHEQLLAKSRELARQEKISESLQLLVENADIVSRSPDLLVQKGVLMLLDEQQEHELRAAEQQFHLALELDPAFAEALLELGWHYLNLVDEPDAAEKYFAAARKVSTSGSKEYVESVEGSASCIRDSQSDNDAVRYILTMDGLSRSQRADLTQRVLADGPVDLD